MDATDAGIVPPLAAPRLAHAAYFSTVFDIGRIAHRLSANHALFSHFSPRQFRLHVDTLGAEKKSGVPYFLTSEVGIAKRPKQNMMRRHATWIAT